MKRLTCNFEQPCMERKQELQTAINLQTMANPSENQATTRLPANKQNIYGLLLGRFHNTLPEEVENGGFTLKTHQIFSVYSTPAEFENRRRNGLGKHMSIVKEGGITLAIRLFLAGGQN